MADDPAPPRCDGWGRSASATSTSREALTRARAGRPGTRTARGSASGARTGRSRSCCTPSPTSENVVGFLFGRGTDGARATRRVTGVTNPAPINGSTQRRPVSDDTATTSSSSRRRTTGWGQWPCRRLARPRVEAKRRVVRRHEGGVRTDSHDPPVEAHDDVEDVFAIRVLEEEQNRDDKHEDVDDAAPAVLPGPADTCASEYRCESVLRYAEQPPADQREPLPLPLRVVDLEPCRVVGLLAERERRVAVGGEGAVAVEPDAPRPAQ